MSERIGERGAARLSAVAVVLVLGGLVAAGVAGKPSRAPARPALTAAPAIAVSTSAPTRGAPAPTPVTEPPRHKITGEDGIFGLPGWPWRADDSAAAPESGQRFGPRFCRLCTSITR